LTRCMELCMHRLPMARTSTINIARSKMSHDPSPPTHDPSPPDHHVGVSLSPPLTATVAGNDDADADDTPSQLAQRIRDCQRAIIEQTCLEPKCLCSLHRKKQATSIADQYGVRVAIKRDGKLVHRWICLHEDCSKESSSNGKSKSVISITVSSRSNATNHLEGTRGIWSKKEKNRQANILYFEELVKNANPAFKEDPHRFSLNILGLLASNHAAPFAFFKSENWKLFASHNLPKLPIQTINIRKPIIEQYLWIKYNIHSQVLQAKEYYAGVPFVCFVVDLYQNPYNTLKFAVFRIAYINPFSANLRSFGLGCLEYNPTLGGSKISTSV
jgi:hypothetical protein